MARKVFLFLFLFIILFVPGLPVSAFDSVEQGSGAMREILEYIYNHHISRPNLDVLTKGSINGMLNTLNDPYTEYLNPDDLKLFTSSLEGEFTGVGVELQDQETYPVIAKILDGSPAQKAGLKTGDLIIKVNGDDMKGLPILEVVEKIRGAVGSQVELLIRRSGLNDFNVNIKREELNIPTCEWKLLKGNVGYICIYTFGSDTAKELNSALIELQKQGLKGLILDLRNDPGGYLQAAVDIAGEFLPGGKLVVTTEDRDGEKEIYYTDGNAKKWDKPLVVLINGHTASAAEVLAGTLQDYKLAVLVGTKSYGKGVVQALVSLESGGALKITVARYYTPLGRSINQKGLEPDRLLSTPEIQLPVARQLIADPDKQQVVYNLKERIITVNGDKVDGFFSPISQGERVYLPLRCTLEALGYEVEWRDAEECISVRGRGKGKGKGKDYLLAVNGKSNSDGKYFSAPEDSIIMKEGSTYISTAALSMFSVKVFDRDAEILLEI